MSVARPRPSAVILVTMLVMVMILMILMMVFAKESEDLQRPAAALGQPIATLGDRWFARLVTQAGVKRIKFHGLRHTSATLLLAAGEPVHVVAARLGHASTKMTFDVYSHSSLEMQQQAASTLSRTLHG